ncbi:MAG: hypothetical protein U5R30_15005 [Deltaproteobacteria bacterium]|nr:hypothetical protein [Deltaproteobacteria bacterium]
MTLIHLYKRFLKQRQQAVLVVDEHGGVAGILTMEDTNIETLLGIEIMDETDTVADMRALAKQQWLKRARTLGTLNREG